MSSVPVLSISCAAVSYDVGGNEHPTGIRATADQISKITYGCGVALSRLGAALEYVEEVKAKYIFSPGEMYGPKKEERFFNVHAVIRGPERKETRTVKIPIEEKERINETLFANLLFSAIVETMRGFVRSARSDLEYWTKALQIPK